MHDVPVLVALLRAEAATAGTPAALERYERFRTGLADRLGVDPDPALQRVHQELLSADAPVRTGLGTTPTSCSAAPTIWSGSGPRWPPGA